jgi:hypothetical protein
MPRAAHEEVPEIGPAGRVARGCILFVGIAVAYTAFAYQNDLNIRRPPVLRVRSSVPGRAHGPAARVVWVLVDGLRLDASRDMAVLGALRAAGVDVAARAEVPTFSGPNFIAQASGIEPAASGVLTNGYTHEVELDSVFRRARMAGLRTAMLTTDDDRVNPVYASWVDVARTGDPDLRLPPAELVFAHIGYVDAAGHAYGGASPEYRSAVARADAAIGRIAAALDPAHEALIVTSDHGHLDQGGHGGPEAEVLRIPIVIWGAGVARDRRIAAARARDVGPTIASLLGLGPLSHATGRSLVRGDAAAARQRAAVEEVVRASRRRLVDRVPATIVLAVVALLIVGRRVPVGVRDVTTSPVFAVVLAALLLATHTLSFSISNDSTAFGVRLTALCAVAGLAQLLIGGRSSLVPAAFATSLAVLGTAELATGHQFLVPADATLSFLPIPAFTGLGFICVAAAAVGMQAAARGDGTPDPWAIPRREQGATIVLVGSEAVDSASPDLDRARKSAAHGSR